MEKTVIFFLSLFVLAVVGGIFVNPHGVKSMSRDVAPQFEFKDYTFYYIDKNGVNEYLSSSEGFHYEDVDIIKDISYYKRERKNINIIKSDTASVYKNYMDFNGSVMYAQKEGYKLNTRDVRYNKSENIIKGSSPFLITSEAGEFEGEAFVIDTEKRTLEAQKIRAVYFYN